MTSPPGRQSTRLQPTARWVFVTFVAVVVWFSSASASASASAEAESKEDWPEPMDMSMLFHYVQIDQLEWRGNEGADFFRWDLQGWWGSDENKLWLKSEGEKNTSGRATGDAEIQLLYSRLIASFWDLQLGVRQDFLYGAGSDHERTFAVLSVDGLAPYWFEVEPALYVSGAGDVSFRLTTTYDLYITQRLVAQPRFELNAAIQDVKKFGVQSGLNDIGLGLRLRYEFRRELAPYIGINWLRQLGDTAGLARNEGDDVDTLGFVAGIRIRF